MTDRADRALVNCNGCQACCKAQRVIVLPDDDQGLLTVPTRKGMGPIEFMLPHKSNGDCYYLADYGCSIWDRAPFVCREFDCRKWLESFPQEYWPQLAADALEGETARSAMERIHELLRLANQPGIAR